MKKIDCKQLANLIYEEINTQLFGSKIVALVASDDPSSDIYLKLKAKKASKLGVVFEVQTASNNKDDVKAIIERLNKREDVNGIFVQLPLFDSLRPYRDEILNTILPSKDIDCLTDANLAKCGDNTAQTLLPATVEATIHTLREIAFEKTCTLSDLVHNKNVVIVNDSKLIGIPLRMALLSLGGVVTNLNKYSLDTKARVKTADILISATGATNLFDHNDIKNGAVVIDVTSVKRNNAVFGDIMYSTELDEKEGYITPVPGGIGPLTVAMLFKNLLKLKTQYAKFGK